MLLVHTADFHLGVGLLEAPAGSAIWQRRVEDFVGRMMEIAREAIRIKADFVMVAGDIFQTTRPHGWLLREFARFIRMLVENRVQVVAIAGNHDQPRLVESSTHLDALAELNIRGFYYARKPMAIDLKGAYSGKRLRFICLPYMHPLLTREGSIDTVAYEKLVESRLRKLAEESTAEYTVTIAHFLVYGAVRGAEIYLKPGVYEAPVSPHIFRIPQVSYTALGHVHKYQELAKRVLYSGSIERVNFGEAEEEKGFITVREERGDLELSFTPLPCRRMASLTVDVSRSANPTARVVEELKSQLLEDAILKLTIKARREQLASLNTREIDRVLEKLKCFYHVLRYDMAYERPGSPMLTSAMTLEEALERYVRQLNLRKSLEEKVIEEGKRILREMHA